MRYKNNQWTLPDTTTVSYEVAQLAVLMDIRDELNTMNRILNCPNFLSIPQKLDAIRRNTMPKKKIKKS